MVVQNSHAWVLKLRGGKGEKGLGFKIDPRMMVRDVDGDYPTLEELQRKDAERAFRKEHGEFFENFEVIESGTVEAKELADMSAEPTALDSRGSSEEYECIYQVPHKVHDPERFFEEQRPLLVARRVWEAAARGDEDEIQLMVAYLGADADAPDPEVFNFTAMHWAAVAGHARVVALLDSLGASLRPSPALAPSALAPRASAVHATGGPLGPARRVRWGRRGLGSAEDATGSTPLHYAADSGRVEVVEELLARGADALAENHFGRTALHWAQDCVFWGYHGDPADRERADRLTPGKLACIRRLRAECGLPDPHDLERLLLPPKSGERAPAPAPAGKRRPPPPDESKATNEIFGVEGDPGDAPTA